MFKLVVAGSRNFNDFQKLTEKLDYFLSAKLREGEEVIILSGAARGADSLGELYAAEHKIRCKRYPADWTLYGKSAGYRRNEIMGDVADALVAFWDGESRGTKHMIDYMRRLGKPVRVVKF